MTDYLGKEIYFNKDRFEAEMAVWNKRVLPAVKTLSECYLKVTGSKLTDKVLKEIQSNGTKAIESKYKENIQKDYDSLKKQFKHLAQLINPGDMETPDLIAFKESAKALSDLVAGGYATVLQPIYIDFSLAFIDDEGAPSVHADRVRAKYIVTVDCEEKNQLYNKLINAVDVLNDLKTFVDDRRFTPGVNPHHYESVIDIGNDFPLIGQGNDGFYVVSEHINSLNI